MNLYINQAEARLTSALPSYEKAYDAIGIYISLATVNINSEAGDIYSIVVNIIRDHFKSVSGDIYLFKNGDIVIFYRGRNEKLIKECLHQVYYLFTEDTGQLSFDESYISKYSKIFYPKEWKNFIALCKKCTLLDDTIKKAAYKGSLISHFSSTIEDSLSTINWDTLVKTSDITKHFADSKSTKVFSEIYADINNLTYIIGENFDIANNIYLKSYFKEFIDLKLLIKLVDLLNKNPDEDVYLLNLNITTIATAEFWTLSNSLSENIKKRIILSISVGDVFTDMTYFLGIREKIVQEGFKLCLDSLDYLSFMQIDRESLGFDLIRIKHQTLFDITELSELEQSLKSKISISGSSRIILEISDNSNIRIGRNLGIMLFQQSKTNV